MSKRKEYCSICGRKLKCYRCENDFCNHHNIQHFRSLIKYFGFDKNILGTEGVEKEFNRVRNILIDLYWNKKMSSTEIAKMFNYTSTPTNITQKFFKNYLDIPVKDLSYSIKENFLQGRESPACSNMYKAGWHTSWDNKKVYLRSSFEFDFAKELDSQKIIYEVEKLRIEYFNTTLRENKIAIPDFYLPSSNTIVEIKSTWTLDTQEMKDKKKAYLALGYNFKLICEHKEIEI